MKWRSCLLTLAAAALLGSGAAASDLGEAAKVLPPVFTLRELPGREYLYFQGRRYPYEAAQLTADMRREGIFLSAYLFSGTIPDDEKALAAPYFQYNLGPAELAGLAALNAAFFNKDAALHKALEDMVSRWADQMAGGTEGARLVVALDEMEPVRRAGDASAILYTAGTRVTLSSEGLILPLYGRAYLYRDGGDYRVLMLITSDDSRQPMMYALEDIAVEAADTAARRDLAAYVQALRAKG